MPTIPPVLVGTPPAWWEVRDGDPVIAWGPFVFEIDGDPEAGFMLRDQVTEGGIPFLSIETRSHQRFWRRTGGLIVRDGAVRVAIEGGQTLIVRPFTDADREWITEPPGAADAPDLLAAAREAWRFDTPITTTD